MPGRRSFSLGEIGIQEIEIEMKDMILYPVYTLLDILMSRGIYRIYLLDYLKFNKIL